MALNHGSDDSSSHFNPPPVGNGSETYLEAYLIGVRSSFAAFVRPAPDLTLDVRVPSLGAFSDSRVIVRETQPYDPPQAAGSHSD